MNGSDSRPQPREYRVDFARGLALLIVFSDHVEGNVVFHFTPGRFGFSDMAEVFVFLSGYVCGITYSKAMERGGFWACQRKACFRSAQLYAANLVMLAATLLLFHLWNQQSNRPALGQSERLREFFQDPLGMLPRALALGVEPMHFAVLPLYIVLLLGLPAVLMLLHRLPIAAVVGSGLLYLSAQLFPEVVTLSQPWRSAWYFNPFAWQFLFYAGTAAVVVNRSGRTVIPRATSLMVAAFVLLELSFLAVTLFPEASISRSDKAQLQPLRLIHFGCLLVVVRAVFPASEAIRQSRLARPFVCCGQNSLATYCAGGFLAIQGTMLMNLTGGNLTWQAVVNVGGWVGCVIAATLASHWGHRQQTAGRMANIAVPCQEVANNADSTDPATAPHSAHDELRRLSEIQAHP